ncbi:MAG: hypothetical protein PF436_08380 [Prolixibacteraceae bacterium]|jgi:hypothetical protein|nr:hypothetical protein [Prolixibacteraceae bacterium]
MKKIHLLSTAFIYFASALFCMAETPDFNESEIYSAFDEIAEVTDFIATNDASYNDLEASDFSITNIGNTAAIATSIQDESKEPPVLSAFWWGCLTGVIGIVVVAVTTDNNKEQIKKSVLGCAIPTGCSILSTVVYYALYATAVSTTYYY